MAQRDIRRCATAKRGTREKLKKTNDQRKKAQKKATNHPGCPTGKKDGP